MRFLRFLKTLPLWPGLRLNYFTNGLADGKAVASASGTTLSADSAHVGEQALFAAAALPGRVARDDARNYQIGWVEGYRTMSGRATPATRQ